jgi:DNA ligase-1
MKFKELAEVFSRVEKTSLRNEKTEILADLLRRVDETELEAVIYLSLGRLRPLYDLWS